jgi:pimeloyl-ACP methyl ester carboxylesterase
MSVKAIPADPDEYDELAALAENAGELGLPPAALPPVERLFVSDGEGQAMSALVFGRADPEIVFLHGGGQNAHTWDSVVLALGRSAVAVDLPGHGHSFTRPDRNYGPWLNAEAVAAVVAQLVHGPVALVGMSLGGATAIRLAATKPALFSSVVIVDVTPQVNDPTRSWSTSQRGTVALLAERPTYSSFEEMASAAIALSPRRDPVAVRRGVRHNAVPLPDGTWRWRHDLFGRRDGGSPSWQDFTSLWEDVSNIKVPAMLVCGGESVFVAAADAREMQRRLPALRVERVTGAGHSVQSDQPSELARLIESFSFGHAVF